MSLEKILLGRVCCYPDFLNFSLTLLVLPVSISPSCEDEAHERSIHNTLLPPPVLTTIY